MKSRGTMKILYITVTDLPDLWFQALYNIFDYGKRHKIQRGSFKGEYRLEYDYFIGQILSPGNLPLLPQIPESFGIPDPVEYDYVFGGDGYDRSYLEYLMTPTKHANEEYTYGERLTHVDLWGTDSLIYNQIDDIISKYKKYGHSNNQMVLQIAQPSDLIKLENPPCLRHIDTKIQDNKLHFFVYFRSWDLWAGLPANLAAIQTLKEHMSSEIGVKDGEMIVESKGLHLYGYAEKLAKIRTGRR